MAVIGVYLNHELGILQNLSKVSNILLEVLKNFCQIKEYQAIEGIK